MIDFLTKKCLRVNIKLLYMKGIKCRKPSLVAGEQIHAYTTISSTGKLNINGDTNMIITSRPLNFTVQGSLNVFWEIEDIGYKLEDTQDNYNDKNHDINNNPVTRMISHKDDDGPHISLPVLLQKNEKGEWQEEMIDIDIGLIVNGEKISLGKASFKVSTDYIGQRKLCLPVRYKTLKKSSISSIKKRISFYKKKKSNDSTTISSSEKNMTQSVSTAPKLFRLSKSANLDLDIDILDILPHLYDKDCAINELDIQETMTEELMAVPRKKTTSKHSNYDNNLEDHNIDHFDMLYETNDNGEIPKKILIKNTESTQSTEITFEKKDLMEPVEEKNTLEKIMDSLSYGNASTSASSSDNNFEGCRFIPRCVQNCGSVM